MKYVIINEGTISIKRIMCNILIVYFTLNSGETQIIYIHGIIWLYRYCWHNYMGWDGNGYTGRAGMFVTGWGEPKCPQYVQKRPPPLCTKSKGVFKGGGSGGSNPPPRNFQIFFKK